MPSVEIVFDACERHVAYPLPLSAAGLGCRCGRDPVPEVIRRSQRGLHSRTRGIPASSLLVEATRSLDACAGLCVAQDCAFYDFFVDNETCHLSVVRAYGPRQGYLTYAPDLNVVTGLGPNFCTSVEPYEAWFEHTLAQRGAPFVPTPQACNEWCLAEYYCGYFSWSFRDKMCTLGRTSGVASRRPEAHATGVRNAGVFGNVVIPELRLCPSQALLEAEWAAPAAA